MVEGEFVFILEVCLFFIIIYVLCVCILFLDYDIIY